VWPLAAWFVVTGAAVCGAVVAACGSASGTHLDCFEGTFACVCYGNSTCNAGLVCVSGVCGQVLADGGINTGTGTGVGVTTTVTSVVTSSGAGSSTGQSTGQTASSGAGSSTGQTTGQSTSQSTGQTTGQSTGQSTSSNASECGNPATACTAGVTSGAIPTNGCIFTAPNGAGEVYYFGDFQNATYGASCASTGSTACVDANAFCGGGTTAPITGNCWGNGIGVRVDQTPSGADASAVTSLSSTGLTWATSAAAPNGFLIAVDAATGACATEAGCCFQPPKGATGGTIPWSSFTDQCYASGVSAFNPATDGLLRINFQVSSTDTPQPWSFCVTTLEF
jgi:hypothetical protein